MLSDSWQTQDHLMLVNKVNPIDNIEKLNKSDHNFIWFSKRIAGMYGIKTPIR